jgi:PAS domain S-box-containing protein
MSQDENSDQTKNLKFIMDAVSRIASGDFDLEFEPPGAVGELDEIRAGLSDLAEKMRSLYEERERQKALVAQDADMWKRSFSQISEGVFIIDKEFRVLQCNDAFAEVIGGTVDEIVGKNCYSVVHGLESASNSCVTCDAINRCMGARAEMYEPFLGKHIEVAADPVLDDNGELVFAIHTLRDVTDRMELIEKEKELIAAETATTLAKKQAEQLTNLINLAAHELRHPATIFRAYSNILLESGDKLDEDTFRDALLAIDKASYRLAQIVSKLLETASVESVALELRKATIAPRSIVIRAVEGIRLSDTDIDLNIKIPENEEFVVVDPELMATALMMLLENAVKFSPEGSPIDVSLRQNVDETIFAVSDRGAGVPEDDRGMIFERFYQVDDIMHHSKPGMGLGLFIARRIVSAHQGWIRHEPRGESGSIFSFGIPVEPEPCWG